MDSKEEDIEKLKEKLLHIDDNTDWNMLLPLNNDILDGLLICESWIKKPRSSQSDNELQGHLNWIESFLKSNGFQYLTNLLNHSKYQTVSSVSCKLLKLVSTIFIDIISCKPSINDIIHEIISLEPNNNALLENFNKIIMEKSGMKPVAFIKDIDDVNVDDDEDDEDEEDEEFSETELGIKFDELLSNIKQRYIQPLITSIDLNKLLRGLWIMMKSATNDAEQMKHCIDLYISLLIYQPDLLLNLFQFIQKDTSFILNAIQSKHSSSNISKWIFRLCAISDDQIIGFFLNHILLKDLPKFDNGDYSHLHDQLCLLGSLLNQYISKYNHSITEFPQLFEYIVSELINYKSEETFHSDINAEGDDEILIGLMTILSVLLIHNESYRDHCCSSGFIDVLWNNFLFANGQTQYDKNNNLPKCKRNKSRELGYRLIIQCLLGNNEKYPVIIKKIKEFENKVNKIPNPDQDYNARLRLKSDISYTGLCGIDYINCLLHQFYMIPTFRNGIINVGADIANKLSDKQCKQSILYQLMRVFSFLSLSIRDTFDSERFCQTLNIDDIKTDQDVQQCLNELNEKLNETINSNLMRDHFGIESYTELICKGGCNNVTERKQDSMIISLPINNKNNLEESLKAYISTENVKDVQCNYCDKKSDALKREIIGSLPNTIFFHLQRFEENTERLQRFDFPLDIDLKPFIREDKSRMDNEINDEYYRYNLVGTIINDESVYTYCFIKDRKTNQWFEFDRDSVGECNINNLVNGTVGGQNDTESAKFLIYERKQEKKTDINDNKLSMEELIEKQTPKIWNEIFNDNVELIHDIQFFSSDYFEFIYNLICIRPKSQSIDDDLLFIKMATTVCFKYLSRTDGKISIFKKFASYLRFLYEGNITASKWFLQYLLTLKTENFSLKHFVLTSRPDAVLQISCDLIICCLKQLNKSINISLISTKFMDRMFELIDIAPLHWFRFNHFWRIFYEYSLIGYTQRNYLIDKQLINILGDLYLGRNRSPYTNDKKEYHIMGNRMYPPNFDTVIQILSILIRSCETPRIRQLLLKQDRMIKFSQSSLLYIDPLSNKNCLHRLSEIDEKLPRCSFFYDKTIGFAHNNKDILNTLNDIIIHWQYEDKSYSLETIKLICQGIDKSGADHEITYHEILKKTIMIEDSLQNWRLKELHLKDKGVLDIIKQYRIQHESCTYVCMQCIIGIMTEYKPYLIYMITKRDDWYYWDQYLDKFCHRPTYLHSRHQRGIQAKIEWYNGKYIAFLNKYINLLVNGYINDTINEINRYIPLDIIPQFMVFFW